MKLEDQIIEELGTQMQSEIDKEILWGMLAGLGWTRVLLPRFNSREANVAVIKWLKDNCKSPYEQKGSEVIFESEQEAAWFVLKWL